MKKSEVPKDNDKKLMFILVTDGSSSDGEADVKFSLMPSRKINESHRVDCLHFSAFELGK